MKITINNEEVLCNKDFTINEEMLNTSSVILNNVYPKTWEQDKDYVSRFYYPKDYSKCKIFDEIVHPTTKEEVEGTNFSIEVDTTKQYEIQTLKGQTTQSGTPTPSSPIPINITTGKQVVSVCGKNFLPNNQTTQTINGITFTMNNDKSVSISGTATAPTDYYFVGGASQYINLGLPSGNYNLSGVVGGSLATYMLYCVQNRNGNLYYYQSVGTTGQVINIQSGDTFRFFIRVLKDAVVNTTIKPMLEKGTTATTYEEYKGNDYEINLGKNLYNANDTTYYGSCTYVSGINTDQYTIKATGTDVIINSQVSAGSSYSSGAGTLIPCKYGETIHYDTGNSNFTKNFITQYNSSKVSLGFANTGRSSGSYTPTNSACEYISIRIGYGSATSGTEYTIAPIIEKGSTGSSYAPYKTPIYLGKIGTYQDYIFRNTTENPLYDSNLEEGQWYIHKEIGRVVLNGSEASWYTGSTQGGGVRYEYRNNDFTDQIENTSIGPILSNYFKATSVNQSYTNVIGISYKNKNSKGLFIYDGTNQTLADFKTWLSTHNTEVYYVLNTPTNTLIEDEELINQLNSIELLDGLNNVSVSSANLPFVMSLMYNYQEGYTEEELYFCGVVENTGNISLNPRHPHYCNLQVLDFKTFLSEGETLDIVIYEKTILEAIEQIIGVIAPYGFVKGNINIYHADEMIGAYSTKDKTAYDVFNYIADITQSRWTTRMVDENTIAIDFYDPNLMPQGTAIQYNNTWFTNNKIIDMNFNYSSRDYRNKQVMLSGEVYSNVETTEILVADGYQTQFNTIDKIGKVSSLLLNGTPVSIITKEEYDLGYDADFYYQPGNKYFESVNLVSTGAILTIVYYAIIEGREVILNQEEIVRVEGMTGRKGVVARYETRNDATTTKELNQIGQSYLKYKGMPEITLKVESLENIWNIGERVEFNSPLEELSTEYMVKKKSINYITTQDNLFYTFELSSNFNSETEINYFDNQRAKTIGNIGSGEFISRNIDIENTANVIFYGLEVNEVQISGESTLQSELQTPLGVE